MPIDMSSTVSMSN